MNLIIIILLMLLNNNIIIIVRYSFIYYGGIQLGLLRFARIEKISKSFIKSDSRNPIIKTNNKSVALN